MTCQPTQPTFTPHDLSTIRIVCACGWTSSELRPEQPGALAQLVTEHRTHLTSQASA